MALIKVAINGYGTIGKRVADAVDAQDDMEVVGVSKTGPSFGCELAAKKGFPLYCTTDESARIASFSSGGYECRGGLSDLLAIADIVVDCAPGKMGADNLSKYTAAGVKHVFQGGEKHSLTGLSYSSNANHAENLDADGTRVVSCNTTGLSRTLVPLYEHCGSLKVECTMIRRAADPGDSNKGPINAIKPVLKVPSHHGSDLMTVKPEIEINSLAVAVPTTLMHVHTIIADLPEGQAQARRREAGQMDVDRDRRRGERHGEKTDAPVIAGGGEGAGQGSALVVACGCYGEPPGMDRSGQRGSRVVRNRVNLTIDPKLVTLQN